MGGEIGVPLPAVACFPARSGHDACPAPARSGHDAGRAPARSGHDACPASAVRAAQPGGHRAHVAAAPDDSGLGHHLVGQPGNAPGSVAVGSVGAGAGSGSVSVGSVVVRTGS